MTEIDLCSKNGKGRYDCWEHDHSLNSLANGLSKLKKNIYCK